MTATLVNQALDAPEPARRLDDDVLQSAEEAVLANPASAAVLPGQGDPQLRAASSATSLPNVQRTLARRVSQQPFAAALLAFGAGALAAALLRSAISRRGADHGR